MGSKLEELQKNKNDRENALNKWINTFINSKNEKIFEYAKLLYDQIVNKAIEEIQTRAKEYAKDGYDHNYISIYFDEKGSFISGFSILQLVENLDSGETLPWKEILRGVEREDSNLGDYYAPIYRYEIRNPGSMLNFISYFKKEDAIAYFDLAKTEVVKKPLPNKGIVGFLNKFKKEESETYGFYKVKTSQLFKDLISNLNKISQKEGFTIVPLFAPDEPNNETGICYQPGGIYIDEIKDGYSRDAKNEEHEFKFPHKDAKSQLNIPIEIYLYFSKSKKNSKNTVIPILK